MLNSITNRAIALLLMSKRLLVKGFWIKLIYIGKKTKVKYIVWTTKQRIKYYFVSNWEGKVYKQNCFHCGLDECYLQKQMWTRKDEGGHSKRERLYSFSKQRGWRLSSSNFQTTSFTTLFMIRCGQCLEWTKIPFSTNVMELWSHEKEIIIGFLRIMTNKWTELRYNSQ